jgi:hypothetical protein
MLVNSGVIFFKKSPGTKKFMAEWYDEWLRFQRWDEQLAFLRAQHNLIGTTTIKHIDLKWNTNHHTDDTIILHYAGQRLARDLFPD